MKTKEIAKFTALVAVYLFCRYRCEDILAKKANPVEDIIPETELVTDCSNWTLISCDTEATVYNAVKEQCNDDPGHTASMYEINLSDVASDHIIAMERTMMAEYGIQYGDIVRVEGTGRWDGIWQVQDTMNKRFAGKHKIDFLVPNHIRHRKWQNVKVYVPADSRTDAAARKTINI